VNDHNNNLLFFSSKPSSHNDNATNQAANAKQVNASNAKK
jgi:hypothetical protein